MMSSFLDLIEDINWHKSRELRTYSEDSGFELVSAVTFWKDLFVRHFIKDKEVSHDDMLFFVRKLQKKGTRYISQYEAHIDVYRKDSKRLPIGDTDIDWEETLYLNVILQKFDYSVTCAVCTRTSPKELQILKKHTHKVFASPSRRSMDCKGENEQISYPNIFFTVDNYDELLSEILVRDGEMVCVELLATDRCGETQAVIFLGSIQYQALKRIHDLRASVSTRIGRKCPKAYFQGQQRIEFVRMKGPAGKGIAEMAVAKQKGANCETPTSEPGFSITSNEFDDEMEVIPIKSYTIVPLFSQCLKPDDQENDYIQRRMSDPSSNLKSYISGWQQRREVKKAISENDFINCYANGVNEIEAGDVRDELDDSNYNRMWAMRGFRQAYHFWKENKRASSPPLHSFITYITLPWHHIIGDLFSNRRLSLIHI